jgi:phosphatidylglycerol:prolipoprotein diacylglycerol transferase
MLPALDSGLPNPYGLVALLSLLVTAWAWTRSPAGKDRRLTWIYFAALAAAAAGAKLAFLLAETHRYLGDPVALVTGRSVSGALLGGYAAVELAKRRLSYERVTGDLFAVVVPLGLVVGRIGCVLGGCCPGLPVGGDPWWALVDRAGVARWPAAFAELAANLLFLAWAFAAARKDWVPRNRFHVYLVAYGLFRFAHEFLRDDARWIGPLGGYHAIALATAAFGAWRFRVRSR